MSSLEKDKINMVLEVVEKRGFIFTFAGDLMYSGFRFKKRKWGFDLYLGFFVFRLCCRSEEWNNRTITIATIMEAGENNNVEIVIKKPQEKTNEDS
jgi:hypothetical protein